MQNLHPSYKNYRKKMRALLPLVFFSFCVFSCNPEPPPRSYRETVEVRCDRTRVHYGAGLSFATFSLKFSYAPSVRRSSERKLAVILVGGLRWDLLSKFAPGSLPGFERYLYCTFLEMRLYW